MKTGPISILQFPLKAGITVLRPKYMSGPAPARQISTAQIKMAVGLFYESPMHCRDIFRKQALTVCRMVSPFDHPLARQNNQGFKSRDSFDASVDSKPKMKPVTFKLYYGFLIW